MERGDGPRRANPSGLRAAFFIVALCTVGDSRRAWRWIEQKMDMHDLHAGELEQP